MIGVSSGFTIIQASTPTARHFWATIEGASKVPYTVRADRMDMDDFAMTFCVLDEYPCTKQFFRDLSPECWEQFCYAFVDHLFRDTAYEHRMKLAVMGKIFEQIRWIAGDCVTEHYTHSGVSIGGIILDIFARKVLSGYNYVNDWGQYRIWIESEGLSTYDDWMKLYTECVIFNTIQPCRS